MLLFSLVGVASCSTSDRTKVAASGTLPLGFESDLVNCITRAFLVPAFYEPHAAW